MSKREEGLELVIHVGRGGVKAFGSFSMSGSRRMVQGRGKVSVVLRKPECRRGEKDQSRFEDGL